MSPNHHDLAIVLSSPSNAVTVTTNDAGEGGALNPVADAYVHALPRFLAVYNHQRPHGGIGGAVPASRL